jgi:5-methylcytosine-specific restriction protein A
MTTYILTWNPGVWPWDDFEDDLATFQRARSLEFTWSSGNNKSIVRGERVFLLRQHSDLGIIGSGTTTSNVFTGPHWTDSRRKLNTVEFRFDDLLPVSDVLPTTQLERLVPEVRWKRIQASGIQVKPPEAAGRLEELWRTHLQRIGREPSPLADEVVGPTRFIEGATKEITINAYERNAAARQACIDHYGCDCAVCGFNFGRVYGEIGDGFIHVHHLRDLATIGVRYRVKPIRDLRPVCPNCHAMLHQHSPAISIEELQTIIQRSPRKAAVS